MRFETKGMDMMKKTMIAMVLAALVGWASVAAADETAAPPVSIDAGTLEQILSFTEKLSPMFASEETSPNDLGTLNGLAQSSGFTDYAQYTGLLQVLLRCVAGLGAEEVLTQLKASVPEAMLPMLGGQFEKLDAEVDAGKKAVDGDTWSLLRENLESIQSRLDGNPAL